MRLESLDALRGVAALAVCWFHLSHGGKLLPPGWLAEASARGHLGVAVFFVISGFVIPWTLRNEPRGLGHYGRFLGKRLLRLHPPFLVACLLAIALNQVSILLPGYRGNLPDDYLSEAGKGLFFDSLYLSGILGKGWALVVAWTLAIEVQFYLLAGLVAPGFARANAWNVCAWLAAASCAPWAVPEPTWVFRWLPIFALGAAAAWLRGVLKKNDILLSFIITCIALANVAAHHGVETMTAALAAFLFILAWKRTPPRVLLWLGSISYSLYLVHVPMSSRVVNLGLRWALEWPGRLALVLAGTGFSLLAAWVFWRWVEWPVHRWSRRCFKSRSDRRG